MSAETIIILFFALCITAYFIFNLIQEIKNNKKPQTSHLAKVIKKRQEKEFIKGRLNLNYFNNKFSKITFEILDNGKKKEFSVPYDKYKKIETGNYVILILQGTRYIDFVKTNELR